MGEVPEEWELIMQYAYELENGEIIEFSMTVSEMGRRQSPTRTIQFKPGETAWDPKSRAVINVGGRLGKRCSVDVEQGGFNHAVPPPYYSDALGVHPSQIKEAHDELANHGIHSEWHKDGRLKIHDRLYRNRVCRALGFFDRDGGGSDPQRTSPCPPAHKRQ